MVRTRAFGLVAAMIPSKLCCTGLGSLAPRLSSDPEGAIPRTAANAVDRRFPGPPGGEEWR
jgi:hypothetical protein